MQKRKINVTVKLLDTSAPLGKAVFQLKIWPREKKGIYWYGYKNAIRNPVPLFGNIVRKKNSTQDPRSCQVYSETNLSRGALLPKTVNGE